MSETKTETVATQFGNVEVETVDCDSCGATIKKENAKKFVIGDFDETVNTKSTSRVSYRFEEGTANDGWACEYCRDEGPASYPRPISASNSVMLFGALAVLWPVWYLVFLGQWEDDTLKLAKAATLGSILWTIAGVLILTQIL